MVYSGKRAFACKGKQLLQSFARRRKAASRSRNFWICQIKNSLWMLYYTHF
jgi:hypothetical protein